MFSKVTEWKMTEEERLAYSEKHPIRPTKRPKRSAIIDHIDYKWKSGKQQPADGPEIIERGGTW